MAIRDCFLIVVTFNWNSYRQFQSRLAKLPGMEKRHGKKAFGIGVLLGAGVTVWFGYLLTAPSPGSLEEALSLVRVGMNQDQAAAAIKSCDQGIESIYCRGHTRDGQSYFKSWFCKSDYEVFTALEFEDCELMAVDDRGNEAYVYFDRTGTVTGTHYVTNVPPSEKMLTKVRQALNHSVIRKAIGRKAREVMHLY